MTAPGKDTKTEEYNMNNTTMTEAAKEARRAYNRKWEAEHKEQRREIMRRYWERKAQERTAAENEEKTPEGGCPNE